MLPTLECEGKYNPDTEMLDITYHKIPMCSQNNSGFIYEDARSRVTGNLAEIQDAICIGAEKIREYVGLYESSPQMTTERHPQVYSVGFVFVHLKKDLVELFLFLLGFCGEELIAGKRDIFLSAVILTI